MSDKDKELYEIECSICDEKIKSGDDFVSLKPKFRRSDGEVEGEPIEYDLCGKKECLIKALHKIYL